MLSARVTIRRQRIKRVQSTYEDRLARDRFHSSGCGKLARLAAAERHLPSHSWSRPLLLSLLMSSPSDPLSTSRVAEPHRPNVHLLEECCGDSRIGSCCDELGCRREGVGGSEEDLPILAFRRLERHVEAWRTREVAGEGCRAIKGRV